ncbi:hydroperoxide isomerase ALOXE3-like [Solea senegalensis]|uniref:Hydroperoxide isomerase ALOXE3-like n=1 Tax=Solea senegalensis TaxID=28829 RepID=A0AAV6RY98_SOLSE|nr:hydroperoxide isomerase ALOXE3-like [Solea senegalensis]
MKVFEDDHPLWIEHRKKELTFKKSLYQWMIVNEGLPHQIVFDDEYKFPAEIRFTKSRIAELSDTMFRMDDWLIDDMKNVFWANKTTISDSLGCLPNDLMSLP